MRIIKFALGLALAMLALFDGKVPAAAASETLPASVAAAMKAARTLNRSVNDLKIPLNLQYHDLAKDRIVVIVNKDNPIKALTKEQLKAIHTGRVRNWQEVGGANSPLGVSARNHEQRRLCPGCRDRNLDR